MTEDHSLHSSIREKTLEHIFIGDCLRVLWARGIRDAEVLSPDVDAGGYDVVMEVHGTLRHIQLKASYNGSRTSSQTINARLSEKPSGCVVWMGFDPETIALGPFLWFGDGPGHPLPDLSGFRKARHTKGDAQGVKGERRNSYTLPRGAFEKVETLEELLGRLFGI